MEQIVRTYGKFLLGAVAFISFWMLAFFGVRDMQGNVGFFQMLGNYFTEKQAVYGADFQACVEESKRSAPVIFYKGEGALVKGLCSVSELIGATDCEGNELTIEVRDISNAFGESDMWMMDRDTMQIRFESPGIYRLQVRAVDRWNGTSECWICVPVN